MARNRSLYLAAQKLAAFSSLLLLSAAMVMGQTTYGRISGTITDSNGAAVPGASVVVSNPSTNFSRSVTTDENGGYTFTNLSVGTYDISVEKTGFKKTIRSQTSLSADARLTVDIALDTGLISEVVEVTQVSGETVNTTSGEVAKVIDAQQLNNLALNGRNYYQLMSIIPGAVVTADDALDTNLATNTININGNRGVSNNLSVDGGNNLNAGSNASQINNVGIDFIQEVKLQTSNFSAEYGRNSGANINVITKRGTNDFRGSLFEYGRNDALDARDAFAAVTPKLRYNNYGFSIGGPMPYPRFSDGSTPAFSNGKGKLFFFGGMEWKKIRRSGATNTQTLPTSAELNGDFRTRLRGFDGIAGTADDGVIRDPNIAGACTAPVVSSTGVVTTAAIRTSCFGGANSAAWNVIPTGRITADGLAYANLYRAMIGLASGYNDSPVANNTVFQVPLTSDFRQAFIRIDFVANEKHSGWFRLLHDTNVVIDPYGTFINSALPTATQLRNRPGLGIQAGHLWNINSNLINEVKFSTSGSNQRVVPSTPYSFREQYGFAFEQLFPDGGQYENSIPNTTLQGGGTFAGFAGVAATLTALTRDYQIMDTLTWVTGDHAVKFGGQFNRNQTFQNGRSLYAGTVIFNGRANNASSTGQAFGDALLGLFSQYQEASYDPASHFRFKQYEAFVNDSWRVNKRLSLELGVRWQYGLPFYTAENTISNFDPAYYDPTRAVVVSSTGVVTVPAGANRWNGLVRAGDGVPAEYLSSLPNPNSPGLAATPTGAPRGFYDPKHYFMPRFGFAYSPTDDGKTSIRGGFGMYVDRIEGNIVFPLENNPPFVDSGTYNNGYLSNIRGGSAAALTPFGNITTIDPDMEASNTMNFSLGIQRELPWGIFVEANGVGTLGRHLTRQRDINSVPFAIQATMPSGANLNFYRPYKGYSGINQRTSDATSSYYGLQLYAAKRRGDLLATVSYTWSHALTDANVLTEAAEDGNFNRRFNYGPATFDRSHVVVGTYTYSLPFFQGSTGWKKALLHGYEISGITRFQSGRPLTITASAAIGTQGATRRADLVAGEPLYLFDDDSDRTWINPAAFVAAPNSRFGNSPVGVVRGYDLFTNDFSLRKRFRIGEKKSLMFQGDLFNAFNRPNYSGIQTVRTSSGFGVFNSSGPGRSIQLGLKFTF
jgi:hypothetical protein